MQKSRYTFMPCFSLSPNQCSSYTSIFYNDYDNERLIPLQAMRGKFHLPGRSQKTDSNLLDNRHKFELSKAAYRNLKQKINWLYYLSKSKKVTTYNGKTIFNFKIGFLTFKLPSQQQHPTAFITSNLFNQLLTELRERTKLENYVWRLEFQKNGNVHYHLVTDTYIDYWFALKIWNRILKNYGYIEPYQSKFKAMTLREYWQNYESNFTRSLQLGKAAQKKTFSQIAKRYARGCKNNWEQPNTVDAKSVISKKAIAAYISKYFGKQPDNQNPANILDKDASASNIRLWFCSRSLSKLKTLRNFCEAQIEDIFSLVAAIPKSITKYHKYCTIYYFDIFMASGFVRKTLEILLKGYAKNNGYIPSG